VLDASAVLALLNEETGGDVVEALLSDSAVSIVNIAEIYTKLIEAGLNENEAEESISLLGLQVEELNNELALSIAKLRPLTKKLGLSLGDRSCLALAMKLKATAVTADKSWRNLSFCSVKIIR
jgi:PIN domain nuclease of toxin-antitoxin system